MKTIWKYGLLFLPLMLAACESGSVQETLGLSREAPDEFTVVSRPPLTVPPEFTLRPPRPGEAPLGTAADAQARSLLTGKPASSVLVDPNKLQEPTVDTAVTPVVTSDVVSGGGASLLKRAGANAADESIREKLSVDAKTPADTSNAESLLDQLSGAEKREPTVDAKQEAERLRSNKDAGKPMTEGEVPVEKQGTESLLDRIF